MQSKRYGGKNGFLLAKADPEDILYETDRSILTRYVNFINNYVSLTSEHIVMANLSIADLYLMAFRGLLGMDLSSNRIRIEAKAKQRHLIRFPDIQMFDPDAAEVMRWLCKYAYCYELRMSADQPASLYQWFLNDLNTFFADKHHFMGRIAKRPMMCLVFSSIEPEDPVLADKAEKLPELAITVKGWVRAFRARARSYSEIPLISETGYALPLGLELVANLQGLKELNHALSGYGFRIAPAQRELEMVIISNIS